MARRDLGSVFACVVCLCATTMALGPATLDEVLSKLSVLEGRVRTFHPAGAEDRAGRMQQLMQDATSYYQARTDTSLMVRLALVGRAESANINPPFAGLLPGASPGPTHTVVLPIGRGHALDGVVRHVVQQSDGLKRLGLSADQLSDRFTELATLHELGHRYARAGLDPTPGWYSEFVASYLAYSFLADRRAEDAAIWSMVCAAFVEHLRPYSRPSGDFHAGIAAGDYAWYLGSLQERVTGVHVRYGAGFLQRVKAVLDQRESADDWEPIRRLLEQASPGFLKWSRQHHRAEPRALVDGVSSCDRAEPPLPKHESSISDALCR
ncbi:MAG: hypothetical protein ACRD1U_03685 [Vicinamibacterales bacterium]